MRFVTVRFIIVALLSIFVSFEPAIGVATKPAEFDKYTQKMVEGLLESELYHERAAGAYYAGKYQFTGLIPILVDLLDKNDRPKENISIELNLLVLDALARMHAYVPPEILMKGAGADGLDAAFIILAYDAKNSADGLLTLMKDSSPDKQHWWAAARALASVGDGRVANELLKALKIYLYVSVNDPGNTDVFNGSSTGGGGGWFRSHAEFPPRVTYFFSQEPKKESVCAVEGRLPVYYQREESIKSGRRVPPVDEGSAARHAWKCLEELYHQEPGGGSLKFTDLETFMIEWSDVTDFKNKLIQKRAEIANQYKSVVEWVEGKGWIERGQSSKPAPIVTKVMDWRTGERSKLPEIP